MTRLFMLALMIGLCSCAHRSDSQAKTRGRCKVSGECRKTAPYCVSGRCGQCGLDRHCNSKNPCQRCDRATRRCVRIRNCCTPKHRCGKKDVCVRRGGVVFGYCKVGGPVEQVCRSGKCPNYPSCTMDGHCRHRYRFCIKGACQQCRTDAHCQNLGMACLGCNAKSHRCELRSECCETGSDCKGHNILCIKKPGRKAGRCQPGCFDDSSCGPGQYCDRGFCRDRKRQP